MKSNEGQHEFDINLEKRKGFSNFFNCFQQLTMFEACYPSVQDLALAIRKFRKDEEREIDEETIQEWEELIFEVDKVMRDRIFVLTVAAERGWRVASDMCFNMKGTGPCPKAKNFFLFERKFFSNYLIRF